ncbi:Spondin-1 [Anabarilius grahami]|uniref:Spondin-1 n=1 Tax=Anabarilius grahami TaxID=495550 RepID=A0A3N0XQL8_ANAGA|nr:Spondin-1 [Anabarilius grahami]
MDSKGPNFTVAETHALLEGVMCHYASIVGSSVAGGMVTNKRKKDIWVEITQNVNTMGSGQKRTLEQVKFRWKNIRARTTKDLAEAKNTQTGNKPFKKGEYTDVVLDIIGGENSKALHRIQGVVGDAEFSVDRTRHLMSFLTMLGPSPDWNVGLSSEDLCTRECGWVQKVVHDLIPWDAGTDSGVTYESPNKPTAPQEKIRPLTSLDHPQSPFYDPEGGAITPVARIVVERIARKGEQCNIVPDNVDDIVADIAQEEKEEDDTPETCIYSNWSPWSACSSSTCEKGKRMRQRMLKAQLDLSVPCPHTQDFEPCMGPGCSDEGVRSRERYVKQFPDDGFPCTHPTEETEPCTVNEECCEYYLSVDTKAPSSCLVTEWGEWDVCSATCGLGMKRRERMVKMPPSDGSICGAEVVEAEKCMMPECHTIPCLLSPWSDWSDCSVTCGKGSRTRQRILKSPAELGECSEELEQLEKCMLPECPMDCVMSAWSEWSECSKSCGKGHLIRTRMITLEPQFGGDPCPETIQRKACKIKKCNQGGLNSDERKRRKEDRKKRRNKQGREESADELAGCKMKSWSGWTDCTKLCGGGIQERLMTAKKRFKNAQLNSCKDRKEIRACNVHPC